MSGFLWRGSEFRLLSAVVERKAILFSSPALLSEFARVLSYERIRPFVGDPRVLIEKLESIAIFVKPKEGVTVVKEDPQDDKVLECALAADADFIISGDKHLLKLRKFRGILIITTPQALEKL